MNALATAAHGRVTIMTPEIVERIIKHLSVGNYVKPSVEAAGINYQTFRTWMIKGEEHKAQGVESPYSSLVDRITRAQADAEAHLVDQLANEQDWRAKSFLLERRHRERWGKEETQAKAAVTINLPAEVAGVLLDALSVGAKHLPAVQVVDASYETVGQSANTPDQLDNPAPPDNATRQRPGK